MPLPEHVSGVGGCSEKQVDSPRLQNSFQSLGFSGFGHSALTKPTSFWVLTPSRRKVVASWSFVKVAVGLSGGSRARRPSLFGSRSLCCYGVGLLHHFLWLLVCYHL